MDKDKVREALANIGRGVVYQKLHAAKRATYHRAIINQVEMAGSNELARDIIDICKPILDGEINEQDVINYVTARYVVRNR